MGGDRNVEGVLSAASYREGVLIAYLTASKEAFQLPIELKFNSISKT